MSSFLYFGYFKRINMEHSFMNDIVILLGKDCVQTGPVNEWSRRKMTPYLHSTFVGICHYHKLSRVTRVFGMMIDSAP